MGYWLRDRIKTWTGLTDTDTQRLDLPKTGILSAIKIRAEAKRSAAARDAVTRCHHLVEDMDKIEVIEGGSKILKSLDGPMWQAHNLMDFKAPAYQQYSEFVSDYNIDDYYLLFGRSIMDTEFGLDLAKHEDVKLQIDHSLDVTTKTGFTTKTLGFEVWIWRYVKGTLPLKGYFKTSEKYHYTQAGAVGENRKTLPCENPIRRILIRNFLETKTIGGCMTAVELVVDDGEYSPFWGTPMQMVIDDISQRGLTPFWTGKLWIPPALVGILTETWIPYNPKPLFAQKNINLIELVLQIITAGQLYWRNDHATSDVFCEMKCSGGGYQYVVSIPFDIPDREESYFPTADLGKLEVVLTETTQKSDVKIVLDELIKE